MHPTPLSIFDTFEAKKRALETLEPGAVGVYCCGPTTYDMSHIGHARAAIAPDILVRTLRSEGLSVKYVRNITDIDDKIIRRASERGESPSTLAERFTVEYETDMRALGNLDPDVSPRVSEHLGEIVTLIGRLMAKGLAYTTEAGVFYRVSGFAAYGRLGKRNLEDLQSGARVEVDERKESPLDFALWKAAKPGEPAWPSPWGEGRPGWHIECSAMSSRHLGERFEIHFGGRDLIFPHHENEIAQSQGAYGEGSFAQYWLHNGFVNFSGEKMSKSLGNFFTIREITRLYHPEALRFFLLSVHYRSPINFDVEEVEGRARFPGLEEADERVAAIYETLDQTAKVGDPEEGPVSEAVGRFLGEVRAAMRDDLNTSAALGALSPALREVNGLLASAKGVDKKLRRRSLARFHADMKIVGEILGVFARDPTVYLVERRDLKAARIQLDVARVEALLRERDEARAAKDWAKADALRGDLAALGVNVRDGAQGSIWTL